MELKNKQSYEEGLVEKNRNPQSQKKQSKDLTMKTFFFFLISTVTTMGKIKRQRTN